MALSISLAAFAAPGPAYTRQAPMPMSGGSSSRAAVATALETFERLGPEHPETLSAMEVRISNLQRQERYSEALAGVDQVIDGRAAAFGPDHPIVERTRWLKGVLLRDVGQYEQALQNFEQRHFRLAAATLGNLLVDCPHDGASLMLMSRVVDALLHESAPFDPVWELPGK